jgi:hypothetical protein
MLRFGIVLVFAGWALPAFGADFTAPLLPAAKGRVQCYSPDPVKKTCKSITGYRIDANGTIESIATTVVSNPPLTIMETIAQVEIRDAKVCAEVREHDILASNFSAEGRGMDLKQTQSMARQALSASKSLLGRSVCTSFAMDGDVYKAHVQVDSSPRPELDQPVAWVALDDGYRIAPPAQ